MNIQSVEDRIKAEYPVIKAFIATHPYSSILVMFIVGMVLGHLV